MDYIEFQQLGGQFPEIPKEAFENSVQLIEPDGRVLSGADAVCGVFEFAETMRWLVRLSRLPGIMLLARLCYRFVATHRSLFSWIMRTSA